MFLTNSSNVFLLEPCQDVPKLLDNQVEVCKGVLNIYRHMIMEHTMNTQTWSVRYSVNMSTTNCFFIIISHVTFLFLTFVFVGQGAVAAGAAAHHGGGDETTAGKPKKRQLR